MTQPDVVGERPAQSARLSMDGASAFRFDRFVLDPGDRQLLSDGRPLELNSRYLDVLLLLVREQGRLVSKERFLAEVWRGIPVTDEALTQGIKMLRRQLGDDAAHPRFIETVPKHGYRFIAHVEGTVPPPRLAAPNAGAFWTAFGMLALAGTIGGAAAGFVGGLVYGFAGASEPLQAGPGGVSVFLVLLCLTVLVATVGAAGVAAGIAATCRTTGRSPAWPVVGGALGGVIVGALAKLLGIDASALLFGQSPGDVTGAGEGAVLGGALGLGLWLAGQCSGPGSLRRGAALGALVGGGAGFLIPALGGEMMGGSLDLLAHRFPGSRLRLDLIGALFGEQGFGPIARYVTGTGEGALFGGCVVGAMQYARRRAG
ncbi:MAG: transcriptional regulator [Croceibacterium sp.]